MTEGPTGADRLREHYADPANAKARVERGRRRFKDRGEEMRRRSLAARRGCDVPPELEEAWIALKRKRISNEDAAAALGLKWSPPKARAKKKRSKPNGRAR